MHDSDMTGKKTLLEMVFFFLMTVLWSPWSSFIFCIIFFFCNECLSDPPGDCWFYLSHSDGTNLESNAGYMGSIYLKTKEALGELFFFFSLLFFSFLCRGPTGTCSPVWERERVCVLAPKPPKKTSGVFSCCWRRMLKISSVFFLFFSFFLLLLFFFF